MSAVKHLITPTKALASGDSGISYGMGRKLKYTSEWRCPSSSRTPTHSTQLTKRLAATVIDPDTPADDGTFIPKLATKFEVSAGTAWRIPMLRTNACNTNNIGVLTATVPPGWCLSQELVKGGREPIEDYAIIIERYQNSMTNEFVLSGVKLHRYHLATGGGLHGPSVVVGAGRPLLEKGMTKYIFNSFEMNQVCNAFIAIRDIHPYFLFEATSVFQAAVDYVLFVYEMRDHNQDVLPQHTAAFMEKNPNLWSSPLNDFPVTQKYVSDWLKWEMETRKYVGVEDEEE